MNFVKMEGLGNDFVVIEGPAPMAEQVRQWCDRHTGIGADGVLRVSKIDHEGAACRMEYWNADGSAVDMCGNGLRCTAAYAYEQGWTAGGSFTVETAVGVRRAEMSSDGMVRVELGPYRVGSRLDIGGRSYVAAEVGNPHAVTFLDGPDGLDLDQAPLAAVGPSLQDHPAFPDGVNVEFVAVSGNGLRVRVWERGVGETRACGTGAAAAAAVACRQGRSGRTAEVELPGGTLGVELADGAAWIEGPAVRVFRGAIP